MLVSGFEIVINTSCVPRAQFSFGLPRKENLLILSNFLEIASEKSISEEFNRILTSILGLILVSKVVVPLPLFPPGVWLFVRLSVPLLPFLVQGALLPFFAWLAVLLPLFAFVLPLSFVAPGNTHPALALPIAPRGEWCFHPKRFFPALPARSAPVRYFFP